MATAILPARPAFAPSTIPIRPAVVRGRLHFQVADVLFPSFAEAATAWSAAEAHRLGIADEIVVLLGERIEALAAMRGAGDDLIRFRSASKREADLAARIRRLRREGGAR